MNAFMCVLRKTFPKRCSKHLPRYVICCRRCTEDHVDFGDYRHAGFGSGTRQFFLSFSVFPFGGGYEPKRKSAELYMHAKCISSFQLRHFSFTVHLTKIDYRVVGKLQTSWEFLPFCATVLEVVELLSYILFRAACTQKLVPEAAKSNKCFPPLTTPLFNLTFLLLPNYSFTYHEQYVPNSC